MAATVTVGARDLRIINAHVDPHAAVGGQLEQLEALVREADKNSGPTLILGDFNTLSKTKVVQTRTFLSRTVTQRRFRPALRPGAGWEFACTLIGFSIAI